MHTDIAIRLIAPFRCQFNLDNTFISVEAQKFSMFLKCIEDGLRGQNELKAQIIPGLYIEVQEHDANKTGPRYVSLNEVGNLFHSPGYLDIYFEKSRKEEMQTEFIAAARYADEKTRRHFSKMVAANFESLFFSIYDHTIGILTIDVELNSQAIHAHPDEWAGLDSWTTHFMVHLQDFLYTRFIYPTLNSISTYVTPHFKKVIIPPSEHVIYGDMLPDTDGNTADGQMLWVNRTLICPPGTVLKGWTHKKLERENAIVIDEALAYLFSGNSVIEMKHGLKGHDLHHYWQGVYIGQYYYAVLDVSNKNISRYVGLSYVARSNKAIRRLSDDMEFVINVMTLFQVRYKDLYMELQGIPFLVFQRIQKEWDFSFIFNSVENKIELCKSNVNRLNQFINQRSQLRVQLVLAIVAGMGMVDLMLELARSTREIGEVKLLDSNDMWGLLHLGAYLSPNAMLWIGCVLAMMVVMTILYNRPR